MTTSWELSGRRRHQPMSGLRRSQHVAGTLGRVQQSRLGRVDLAAQVRHVGLDDPGLALEVVVRHTRSRIVFFDRTRSGLAMNRRSRLNSVGSADQFAVLANLVTVFVEFEVGHAEPGRHACRTFAGPGRSASNRAITSSRLNGFVT